MTKHEGELRQWLLAETPESFDGLDERSRNVYRRMVRRGLKRGVAIGIPIARRLLGADRWDDLFSRWLDESPPTTRLYWQLPLEFARWLREQPELPHPALADLVHWETIQIDVKNSPDPELEISCKEPALNRAICLDPSARLGIYHYPVFELTKSDEEWPERLAQPALLITYRREESVYWRKLSPMTAQLLARGASGDELSEGFSFLEELYGEVDKEELFSELEKLVERGILLGFTEE